MARKRTPEDGMPLSPLAAKLSSQLVKPGQRPVVDNAAELQSVAHSDSRKDVGEDVIPDPPSKTAKSHEPIESPVPVKKKKKPSRTRKSKEARVMLDAEEWEAKDEILAALRQASGEKVEFSHLMRALLSLASAAVPAIESNASHISLPDRPANNDLMALAAFEDEIGHFLLLAFRDKKAMDMD